MWLSTKKGLFRYSGYEMKHYKYDALDPNSIPSDQLESISVDTAGNIWLATLGSGLLKFDPITQKFTQYRHSNEDTNSLSADWIAVVLCDGKGNIWVGTGNGLDRLDAATGIFHHYRSNAADQNTLSSDEVVGLYEDRQGTLWVGTGSVYGPNRLNAELGGLNRMDDISGKFTRFVHNANDTSSLINNKVRAIYESRDGMFWVGTAGDGLHTMDRKTGKFTRHRVDSYGNLSRTPLTNDPHAMISFITEDVTGAMWIGTTDNGIRYYDPRTGRNVNLATDTEERHFGNENTWAAYTSADGILWISTLFGNLYTHNPVEERIPFVALKEGEVNGFHEDSNGNLWVASSESGLYQLNKQRDIIRHYVHDPANPNSLRTNNLLSMAADDKSNLWIGTLGHGVERFSMKTGRVEHYPRNPRDANSVSNDTVIRMYHDNEGNIWAGTFRGLNLFNNQTKSFTHFIIYPDDTSRFGKNLVSAIYQDRSNKCWVGSFVGGGVHTLNPKTGALKTYLQGISTSGLIQDSGGRLWVGGVEGLFYYDPNSDSFVRFNDPLGLSQILDVKSIVEDAEKNLWISTATSLKKISAARDLVTSYDHHVGIDQEITYGISYRGARGNLFFPANEGFYELNPDEFNEKSKAPLIALSNFRISNQEVLPGSNSVLSKDIAETDHIALNYKQNIFSFDFAAIDFVDPQANKHLFMLENYDRTWNVAGSDRRALYFNVPPGNYVFRVKAVNAYGKWSEKAVSIEIVPAWWSRWWFRLSVLLAVVAIIYFLVKWRLHEKYRLQMERSEKEKELSRLQHRTAQLEMHALRAQMNPHFLFNSLNSINRFIIQNNSDQASGYLTKFSRLMRLILQNSQHELIPLESELEALRLYLELEAVRFDHHFTYSINVDDNLDMSMVKVPPLIIQPYAENAIWHGLMHKEEKGKLVIDIREEGDYLICGITDDGIGRKKAGELKSKSASTHKSMGMKITADRIASMKWRKTNDNGIQITDLVLPDGTPAGTRVEIKIPIQYD